MNTDQMYNLLPMLPILFGILVLLNHELKAKARYNDDALLSAWREEEKGLREFYEKTVKNRFEDFVNEYNAKKLKKEGK